VRIYPTYKVASDLNLLDNLCGPALPLIASATATLLFPAFFMTCRMSWSRHRASWRGTFRFLLDTLLPLSRTTCGAVRDPVILGWNQYLGRC